MKTNGRHPAKYFLDMVNRIHYNLHDGYFQTEDHHWRSDCANKYVTVHHAERRNDEKEGTYYLIELDGSVRMKNAYDESVVKMTINDLNGYDFELFSPIFIYKCGYVVLEPLNEIDSKGYAKKVLSNLHHYISSLEPDYWQRNSDEKITYPVLVGGSSWDNGLTDEFSYMSTAGLEVRIQTIREFCKENENRKYFELSPIPFMKEMDSNSAFHVTFSDFVRKEMSAEDRIKRCNRAVRELMEYINSTTIPTREYDFEADDYKSFLVRNAKWINTRLNVPLFEN